MDAEGSACVVRVFVSSPSDVAPERGRVQAVAAKLNREYEGLVRFETVLWEEHFYKADRSFQPQIDRIGQPGACDVLVSIFWTRVGTELPVEFARMPNGEAYPSGTAYELLTALEASKAKGIPDVYVFRKTADAALPTNDAERRRAAQNQLDALEAFWSEWFKSEQGHFKAAFQTFVTTDEFERQIEDLLRQWLDSHHRLGPRLRWPLEKGSPFRGLDPFDARYAPVFFGRARDIARAAERFKVAATPFLLIVGASGAGKSSLVRAGLIPRICAPGYIAGVDIWRVAIMRPAVGPTPIHSLAEALFAQSLELAGLARSLPELGAGDYSRSEALAQLLARGDESSVRPIIGALNRVAAEEQVRGGFDRPLRAELLLVVDQLDELFADDQSELNRHSFAQLLAALIGTCHVRIIATLRGALYERFLDDPTLRELKQSGADYDLSRPGHSELAEIVRGPAIAAGLQFDASGYGQSLDDRLIDDAAGTDPLPLLQFTLHRLYEARNGAVLTFAAYEAMGGLGGAINDAAEAVLASDPIYRPELPPLLRRLLVPLQDNAATTPGRPALTIRSVPVADVAPEHSHARRLVDSLVDARILTLDREGRVPTVRLAHQHVIESWNRAREIAKSNADFYRIRREVEEQQLRWERSGRKGELLLARGLPLAEGEQLVAGYGAELTSSARAFVAASGRRARARQRMMVAAAVAAIMLGAAATVGGLLAWRAQNLAETERTQAIAIQSSFLAALARQAHDRGDNQTAITLALQALPDVNSYNNQTTQSSAETILFAAIADYRSATNQPVTVFFSPDGGRIATVMPDFSVQIADAATRKVITVLRGAVDQITSGIFSPDGRRIATASMDRTVRLWDAQSGAEIMMFAGHTDVVTGVEFSPDSRLLVSTSFDHTARIWDATSGRAIAVLKSSAEANSAAFSPDGTHVAIALNGNSVVTWDINTYKQQYVLKHDAQVLQVAYSLDGRRIASATSLGDVSIWNAATGDRMAVLQPQKH